MTGKGAGLTNFILFDAEGNEISNTTIQVVGADAYIGGEDAYVRKRHEVRVFSTWGGPIQSERELQTIIGTCARRTAAPYKSRSLSN